MQVYVPSARELRGLVCACAHLNVHMGSWSRLVRRSDAVLCGEVWSVASACSRGKAVVWIGDRAPEAVVHGWLWQPQGLWVASRGFCSSCEMRVGAVGARCVRAASPTHALERGVLSRSPSAAERRSPTSCNNKI